MIAYQCTQAQDYAVTTKGDTIYGKIKALTFGPDKKLQVTEQGKKKITYPLFQVQSFTQDGDVYVPAKGPAGYTFMKVLKSGYLSLLAFQLENQVTFDGRYLLKKNGEGVEVPNLAFKKTLRNFLSDCGNIGEKIESGTYGKKDLDLIIDEYNACVKGNQAVKNAGIEVRADIADRLVSWNELETKVKNTEEFAGKSDGLEMIADIKGKLSRGEKVPNFIVEGLKSTLNREDLQPALQEALKHLN
jgi:hypothetical protein